MKKRRVKLPSQVKEDLLKAAMLDLVPNTNFEQFIDFIRDEIDVNVRIITEEQIVANERLSTAYAGAIGALQKIVDKYDDMKQQLADGSFENAPQSQETS